MPNDEDYYYEALPFAETHPDHLGAIGTLFGLRPAPSSRCRLLEIGTATGGNILPMAAAFAHSEFVGIDRAAASLSVATNHANACGISNISFRLEDVREFHDEPESYDYIVCHGVYSWVPDDARAALRALVRRYLAPHGIAYISFNTLPGWHLRGALRDMLRREVRGIVSQRERVAKARKFLDFLASVENTNDATRAWLDQELAMLRQTPDDYLLGEHLVETNHAEYFEDFVRDIRKNGLEFVADAHVPMVFPERLGEAAASAVHARGADVVSMQQSMDLLELRYFRRAVVCRDDAPLDRRVSAQRLRSLFIASSPRSDVIETEQPVLAAALGVLADAAPRGLALSKIEELVAVRLDKALLEEDQRARLSRNLLGLYTKGLLRLWGSDKPVCNEAKDRPRAFSYARYQARAGHTFCTTLLHEVLRIDSVDRVLVAHMDGVHDIDALVRATVDEARQGNVVVEMNGEVRSDEDLFQDIVKEKVKRLSRSGLFTTNAQTPLS